MLYDNETFCTPIIIEVCHPNGLNNDLKKVIRLIEDNDYGIEEGFIYDYVRGIWSKYQKGVGQVYSDVSYSNILDIDLATLLQQSLTPQTFHRVHQGGFDALETHR